MTGKVQLGQKSLERLATVHPDLKRVVLAAFEECPFDVTVLEGVRTLERQKQLLAEGRSQTMKSYHLKHGDGYSHAVDLAPYPIDWKNTQQFTKLADIIKTKAKELNILLTWGGDWKSFKDLPHYQIETN